MVQPSKTQASLPKRKHDLIQSEMTMAHDDYESTLIRRALYKTNDHEVSKDLVQTTFLKTLQYLRKGGEDRPYEKFFEPHSQCAYS